MEWRLFLGLRGAEMRVGAHEDKMDASRRLGGRSQIHRVDDKAVQELMERLQKQTGPDSD